LRGSVARKKWFQAYFETAQRHLAYNLALKLADLSEEARVLLRRQGWDPFLASNGRKNEELVRIFYATLVVVKGEWPTIYEAMVRGVRVPFRRSDLAVFMNVSNPEESISFTDGDVFELRTLIETLAPGEEWKKMAFRSDAMEDLPRLIHYINVHSFMVTSNRSEVRHKHVTFIYALINNLGDISLPNIFLDIMCATAKERARAFSLPFPVLITRIC